MFTNKRNANKDVAIAQQKEMILSGMREIDLAQQADSGVTTEDGDTSESLPPMTFEQHHQIADDTRHGTNIRAIIRERGDEPAYAVSVYLRLNLTYAD